MEISVKELRAQLGRFVAMAQAGEDITITLRGKAVAKIVPIGNKQKTYSSSKLFGMWTDRGDLEDPTAYVESIRKGGGA